MSRVQADVVDRAADAGLLAYTLFLHVNRAPPPPDYSRTVHLVYRALTGPYLTHALGAWEARSTASVHLFTKYYRSLVNGVPELVPARMAGLAQHLYHSLVHADLFDRTSRIYPYRKYTDQRTVLYLIRHVFLVARPGAGHAGLRPFKDDPLVSPDIVYPLLEASVGSASDAGGGADEA